LLNRPDIVLVCHAVNRIDATTELVQKIQRVARNSRLLTTREIVLGDGDFIPTCSILVRRSILDHRPAWWEEAPIGDYPLVLRAAQLGHIAYLDRVMGAYRINVPGSWTLRHRNKSDIENRYAHALGIKVMMSGFNNEPGNKKFSNVVNFIIRRYIFNAIVRSTGDIRRKYEILKLETSTLTYGDYIIARLSLATGKKLYRLRELPGKIRHYFNSLINDLICSNIDY
jgi:hypothetical protein